MDPSDKLAIITGAYRVPCSSLQVSEVTEILMLATEELMRVADHAAGFSELGEQIRPSHLGIKVAAFSLDPSHTYEVEDEVVTDFEYPKLPARRCLKLIELPVQGDTTAAYTRRWLYLDRRYSFIVVTKHLLAGKSMLLVRKRVDTVTRSTAVSAPASWKTFENDLALRPDLMIKALGRINWSLSSAIQTRREIIARLEFSHMIVSGMRSKLANN